MSRLDQHIAKVQGKMLLSRVLQALAWALLVYGGLVWVVIVVTRLIGIERLPRQWWLLLSGLALASAVAVAYAYWRRPGRRQAAVAIDERLGLKEKFSTALYVRKSADPFEAAAVRDAESTAERVHLQDKFPIQFPRTAAFTLAMAFVAFVTGWLLQPMDLFGRKAEQAKAAQEQAKQAEANTELKKAIATIESAPAIVQKEEKIQLAVRELKQMLNRPTKDPTSAARTAQAALEDVKAQAQKIKQLQSHAQAMNEMQKWEQLASKPIDESGPVGKAQSAMAKGEFSKAVDLLKDTVDNFDKMERKDKDKAADQMKDMAQQLQQMAKDPQVKKEIEKQLQQMGAKPQQAQQMANAMQQAANGDKQAQQQLQQMANQMMQQMNNGQGPNQQQVQQAQAMLNKLQQQANGQAQAQQLAQNAQKMAQAMQQAAQAAQQGQQGQQGNPQQAQQGQQAQANQQGGKGQQQGNQGQQQQQQAAQQQMQQQMAQMQAMADAAAQQGAGADGQQQGGGQQPGGQDPGQGGQAQAKGGGQPQAGGGDGKFEKGDPNRRGGDGDGGGGGAAMAAGRRADPQAAPFDVKQELSRSQTDDKGKLLASTFVKASALKGESKAQLRDVTAALDGEATDEVDQTRVSRQAREAVKEYHRSIQSDTAGAATPAPAPAPAK